MSSRPTLMQFMLRTEIPDYGPDLEVDVAADELAIPVTHPMVAKTTGADAEA
jgi:hypothetical protein